MKFEIDRGMVDVLIRYFAERPFKEADPFIKALTSLKPLHLQEVKPVVQEESTSVQ